MKLFEKLVEAALSKSPIIEKLISSIAGVTTELHKLSLTMTDIAKALQDHSIMINDLYDRNDMIIKILKKESTELKLDLPNDKDKPSKPN